MDWLQWSLRGLKKNVTDVLLIVMWPKPSNSCRFSVAFRTADLQMDREGFNHQSMYYVLTRGEMVIPTTWLIERKTVQSLKRLVCRSIEFSKLYTGVFTHIIHTDELCCCRPNEDIDRHG